MLSEQTNTISSYDKTAEEYSRTIASLSNYDHTYDSLIGRLTPDCSVLDLACGTGVISSYLQSRISCRITGLDLSEGMLTIARKNLPSATFLNRSIIDFSLPKKFDVIINGFGLPYLGPDQARESLTRSAEHLVDGGYIYVSFMEGSGSRIETTSFGGSNPFMIFYHSKRDMTLNAESAGLNLECDWELDYKEPDGSISKDIVLIFQKTV